MLSRTKDFLIRAHEALNELGYELKSDDFNYDKFFEAGIYTINHSREFADTKDAAWMINWLDSNFDKLLDKVTKHHDFWDSLPYEGRELIAVVDDDEAQGVYTISNAYFQDYNSIAVSSQSFDGEHFCLYNDYGLFSIYGDESEYFLRHSRLSSEKMVLQDKEKNKIALLVLSRNYDVFLENNKTDYDIQLYESGMAVFRKEYLKECEGSPDIERCSAFIQWDIIEDESQFGVSRLEIYDEDIDLELVLLFAASCLLLYRSYRKAISMRTVRMATNAAIMGSFWRRR